MTAPVRSIFMCLVITSIASANDDVTSAKLDDALTTYRAAMDQSDHASRLAKFHRAEQLFRNLVESSDTPLSNPDMYTNIGNAALQAERLGPAIVAYRRAIEIDPDHVQAKQNLKHARSLLPDWIAKPEQSSLADTFFFWHRSLSLNERLLIAAGVCVLTAICFAVYIRLGYSWARNLAMIPLAIQVALIASVVIETFESAGAEGVIIVEYTVARSADSANAQPRFANELPSGTEVTILESRDDWTQIRLPDGRDGWVNTVSIQIVR